MENKIIYFDNAATTRPLDDALKIYEQSEIDYFANASSSHILGENNARKLNEARESILNSFKMKDHEVIFTSGATESNNLIIKGFMHRYKALGNHLIVSSIEHPSILLAAKSLEEEGFSVTYLPVNNLGKVNLLDLKNAITSQTILVSIMGVNNEVGSINDIAQIADLLKEYPKIKFHVDAVQAVGKVNLPYDKIDLLTVSLHKLGGLKGTGLLIKRKKIELTPIVNGGGQEFGYRSGTNDVGMALTDAFVIKHAIDHFNDYNYMLDLVRPLYKFLLAHPDRYSVNSEMSFPYILNFSFLKKKGSVMKEALSNMGIMVATKSACSSKIDSGSTTLLAMGKDKVIAANAIRLSFNINNTKEEIDTFISALETLEKRVRG